MTLLHSQITRDVIKVVAATPTGFKLPSTIVPRLSQSPGSQSPVPLNPMGPVRIHHRREAIAVIRDSQVEQVIANGTLGKAVRCVQEIPRQSQSPQVIARSAPLSHPCDSNQVPRRRGAPPPTPRQGIEIVIGPSLSHTVHALPARDSHFLQVKYPLNTNPCTAAVRPPLGVSVLVHSR